MVKALRQGNNNFFQLAEIIEDYAIVILNENGIVEDWNRGAENIKGYEAGEIIGKSFKVFYSSEDQRKKLPEQLLAQAAKNGKAKIEGWRVRKDGTKFWGSISMTVLHNENKEIEGYLKITRDLSERKKSEELLMQKNAMLLEAERTAKMCSWTWDIPSDIFGWSESAATFSISALTIPLTTISFYGQYLKKTKRRCAIPSAIYCLPRRFNEFSFRIVTSEKQVKDVTCIGRLILDEEGNAERAVGTLQDVTEKKNYIRHIEEKNRKLQEIAQIQSHKRAQPNSQYIGRLRNFRLRQCKC